MNWSAWIKLLPWRLGFISLTLILFFVNGCQFGVSREQSERQSVDVAKAAEVARQQIRVQEENARRVKITKDIANEFDKKKAVLADLHPVFSDGLVRMRRSTQSSQFSVPQISGVTAPTETGASDPISASSMIDSRTGCDQLARDAAETTLMLMEFQRWYAGQSADK